MGISIPSAQGNRRAIVLFTVVAAFLATFFAVRALAAAEEEVAAADLSGSSKTVDRVEATAGSSLQYTVVVSNSGDDNATVVLTDRLPVNVTFQSLERPVEDQFILESSGVENGLITMTGLLGNSGRVELEITVTLTDSLAPGQYVTNTVEITGAGSLLTKSAGTLIVTEPPTKTLFMPINFRSPPRITLFSTRPNSANTWTLSWSDGSSGVTGYELQESRDPDFASPNTYNLGSTATSQPITHIPSFNNVYHYRARAIAGSSIGPWSDVLTVVGGYRDDFKDDSSGWEIRRTTFIEEVRSWYEIEDDKDWLIMQVEDSWDWGISSSKAQAPSPPYVIEYRSKTVTTGNLVSHGIVFGGDWPGEICPDKSTVAGWYEHKLCFNQFYLTNKIFYGKLKMLFERVNRLVYCPSDPNCDPGGSPMKRDSENIEVDPIPNVDADDWNTWRIEVRESGIKVYANGRLFLEESDTRYIHQPYFGVFASTDEYSNSTARYEYFQIMPLDS